MIVYRGHPHFVQCMPQKRVRSGIKVWRRDSESAFISQFQINFSKQQQTTLQQKHTSRNHQYPHIQHHEPVVSFVF